MPVFGAAAEPRTQLAYCQQTLSRIANEPLLTFDLYPDYLLSRHRDTLPSGDERGLAWCESTLWTQVTNTLRHQPTLVNRQCSRTDRIPEHYQGLKTYFLGIPELTCDADWFGMIGPEQWSGLQPLLADFNTLEYGCYQGLQALTRDSRLRRGQARSHYNAVTVSRQVFDERWRVHLATLAPPVREALEARMSQLNECQRLLAAGLETDAEQGSRTFLSD